jgi:ADP-heptose:LPS heptosyltransferase
MSESRSSINPRAFRKTRNLTIARFSEAARPLLSLASSVVSRGPRTDPRQWRKGLIISHTHMGDVLYRTCSLPQLSTGLPECQWSYLASPLSAHVLENNHHIAEALPFVTGENSWDLRSDGFAQLRKRKFDVALCTNTLRHYPDLALATALGIPNRVGFVGKGMSGLINHPVVLNYPKPYPAYFRDLVAEITGRQADGELRPKVYLREQHRREASEVRQTLELPVGRPVLACTLSTRQGTGAVSPAVFIGILKRAREIADFDVALCGSQEEREPLESIARSLPFEAKVLAGRLTVMGFAAFLSTCFALVSPDSGPRHLANAVRIPLFFTRNLSQLAVETGKYCGTETDLIPHGHELVENVAQVESQIDIDGAARLITALLTATAMRA